MLVTHADQAPEKSEETGEVTTTFGVSFSVSLEPQGGIGK